MLTDNVAENLEQQLQSIYAEREWLSEELGVTDAEEVVSMVRNLEAQLHDFYRQYGNRAPLSNAAAEQLLTYVQELSQTLDDMYTEKSISFELDGDKPVLKAVWKETFNNGESR